MSLKYRISDNDTEIGPFDIMDVRAMFLKGSISNKARIRADGTEDAWQLITAEYPMWGKGREAAAPTRKHRRLIARAAQARKRRHFRSKPLGYICFAVVAFLWIAPVIRLFQMQHLGGDRTVATINPFGLIVSALLIWWGKRLISDSAEEAMTKDPRRPVVYFRSFEDDLRFAWSSKKHGRPLFFGRYRTEEEQIVKELKRIGPVVAIGNPEEKVPLAGASRLYTTDDLWRETAEQLLDRAALVVYRVGTTPGFIWEVKRGRQHLSPDRVIILLPPFKDRYSPPGYSEFRTKLADTLSLPELPGGPIIAFQENWTPIVLEGDSARFYKILGTFVSSRARRSS